MARRGFGEVWEPRDPATRDAVTGNCITPGYSPVSDTRCAKIVKSRLETEAEQYAKGEATIVMPEMEIVGQVPEPLIRAPNIVSAAVAAGMFFLKWKKTAAVLGVVNALDIVGRQVSPQYRAMVNHGKLPVAGLGFIPGIRNVRWR